MNVNVIITLLFVASAAINVWLFRRKRDNPARQSARSTLMQGIENVRELATVRQNFQSIVMFEDSKALLGIPLPGTGRKFILKYSGTAVWGNDLSKVRVVERFAVNRVRIFVPYSRLLDLYADMESVKVYDQKAGLFTSIRLEDQNQEISRNLEEVRQEALSSDLLQRANRNTRMLLTSLAASVGLEAEVLFEGEDNLNVMPKEPAVHEDTVDEKAVLLPEESSEVKLFETELAELPGKM